MEKKISIEEKNSMEDGIRHEKKKKKIFEGR